MNSRCYVNKAGAAALCAPKCQQAGPLLQIDEFWQCHESRGQEWSPCGQTPAWCLCPAFPWHCWARGSRHCGKRAALRITLWMSAADVSISLPYLVTIMKTVVLQACLNTRERWIFILSAWFLLAVSPGWVFLPTCFEERSLLKHHPSSWHREWQEEKLLQDALPDRVMMVLTSEVITKEGKDHRAFHTSTLPYPSW